MIDCYIMRNGILRQTSNGFETILNIESISNFYWTDFIGFAVQKVAYYNYMRLELSIKKVELNQFEKDFIKFCRRRCTQDCDTMLLESGQLRYEELADTCPILRFEQYTANKHDRKYNVKERMKDITQSQLWNRIKK